MSASEVKANACKTNINGKALIKKPSIDLHSVNEEEDVGLDNAPKKSNDLNSIEIFKHSSNKSEIEASTSGKDVAKINDDNSNSKNNNDIEVININDDGENEENDSEIQIINLEEPTKAVKNFSNLSSSEDFSLSAGYPYYNSLTEKIPDFKAGEYKAVKLPHTGTLLLSENEVIIESPSILVPLLIKETDQFPKHEEKEKVVNSKNLTINKQNVVSKQNYFQSSVGQFLINLGSSRVQEWYHRDMKNAKLIQKRSKSYTDENLNEALAAHEKRLSRLKEINAIFSLRMKQCKFCNFKSESAVVMEGHYLTPHLSSRREFRCNFCVFLSKTASEMACHYRDIHQKKAVFESTIHFYECTFCPFQSRIENKITAHMKQCRIFLFEKLAPPFDFEFPGVTTKPLTIADVNNYRALLSNSARNQNFIFNRNTPQRSVVSQPVRLLLFTNAAGSSGMIGQPQNNLPVNFEAIKPAVAPNHRLKIPPSHLMKGNFGNTFVICEICDYHLKDMEELGIHMSSVHKIQIHPNKLMSKPNLNCQKCQWMFFTDQGLERHLLGAHGLVTPNMQQLASRNQDGGKCMICSAVYAYKLVSHMTIAHRIALKLVNLFYKCTLCDLTFKLFTLYESHVNNVHIGTMNRSTEEPPVIDLPSKKPAVGPRKCKECGQVTENIDEHIVSKHMKKCRIKLCHIEKCKKCLYSSNEVVVIRMSDFNLHDEDVSENKDSSEESSESNKEKDTGKSPKKKVGRITPRKKAEKEQVLKREKNKDIVNDEDNTAGVEIIDISDSETSVGNSPRKSTRNQKRETKENVTDRSKIDKVQSINKNLSDVGKSVSETLEKKKIFGKEEKIPKAKKSSKAATNSNDDTEETHNLPKNWEKNKDIVNKDNTENWKITNNAETKTEPFVKKTSKASKRNQKGKIEEKENVIDLTEEIQIVEEDLALVEESINGTPSKKKNVAKEEKTTKSKKISKSASDSSDVTEETHNPSDDWEKKKNIVNDEDTVDEEIATKTEPFVEKTPRTSKRNQKRKIEERVTLTDKSSKKEVQKKDEESVSETPAKKKRVANEEKTPKSKKAPKSATDSSNDNEETHNMPKNLGIKNDLIDDDATSEELTNNAKTKTGSLVQNTPRTSKRNQKREKEEIGKVIDKSLINEDQTAVEESFSETPAKRKKVAKEENTPKNKKSPKSTTNSNDDIKARGGKKDIVNGEDATGEEIINNAESETGPSAEKTPRTSKRNQNKKIEEKENVIDKSLKKEQNMIEDQSVDEESASKTPSKNKMRAKEEKTHKAEKTPKATTNNTEKTPKMPKGWVRKEIVRKSGKTAGMTDVYIYSPEGQKFRSRPDLASFLIKNKSPLKIESFDFKRK